MALSDFLSKPEGQLRAEQALIDAEDRLLAYHPDEGTDLPFHAQRDADRLKVVIARQRLTHEMVKMTARRNIVVTLVVGIVLLAKGIVTPASLSDALKAVFPAAQASAPITAP